MGHAGREAADLVARVLAGERPADIPVVVKDRARDTVDWRELKHWGIPEDRLPPGSVVMFKEHGLWERARGLIVGAATLLLAQAALILWLAITRHKRRLAEAALRDSLRREQMMLEQVPALLWTVDTNLRFTSSVGAGLKSLGLNPGQAVGLTLFEYFQTQDPDYMAIDIHKKALLGVSDSYEIHWSGRTFQTYVEPLRDPDGTISGATGVALDVTERKKTEEAVRSIVEGVRGQSSQQFFASMARQLCSALAADFALIGELLPGREDVIQTLAIWSNGAITENVTYELAGTACDHVTRQGVCSFPSGITDLFPHDAMLREMRAQAFAGVPLFDSHKNVLGVVEIFFVEPKGDIGFVESILQIFSTQIAAEVERKRSEEAVRQAEERFSKAFRNSPEGITITTLHDGRYIEANAAFLKMLGYSPAELIGKTVAELDLWVNPQDRALVAEQLRTHQSFRERDVTLRAKSGKICPVRLSAETIQLQNQECVLAVIRDVTEQNLLEQQFRQAQKMEAVGRLAGGIAHDFNNLLGVILGYSELLAEELAAHPHLCQRVEAIQKAGNGAAALTAQLLAFSRRQVLQPRIINLNAAVTEAEKMLRRLIGEDVDLIISQDPKLKQVKADPGHILQVLMNLAVNARDAMPKGGKLTIETGNTQFAQGATIQGVPIAPGAYVLMSMSDTGTGMDPVTKAQIFEPFFTTKPLGKGTGLGMATVYGIVKQSGGYIFVESESEKGATFKIYLPQADDSADVKTTPVPAPQERLRGSETILLVEDDAMLRDLLQESLQDAGFTVMIAFNGAHALEVAEKHKGTIHLLVTDVIMPQMSGPDLVHWLSLARPQTKVLYMSGYPDDKLADLPTSDPDVALIQKPFRLESFLLKVQEALKRSKAARAARG